MIQWSDHMTINFLLKVGGTQTQSQTVSLAQIINIANLNVIETLGGLWVRLSYHTHRQSVSHTVTVSVTVSVSH